MWPRRIRALTQALGLPVSSPNPYSPANSPVIGSPETGSPIKAIIFGLVVGIGGSTLFGIICGTAFGASLAASGMSPMQIVAATYRIQPGSWLFIALTGGNCLFSVLGGYVCARLSKHSEYRFGLILASLTMLFDSLMSTRQYSIVLSLALGVAAFASVLAGVKLGRAKGEKA
jgi:hypothetical protein